MHYSNIFSLGISDNSTSDQTVIKLLFFIMSEKWELSSLAAMLDLPAKTDTEDFRGW